MKTRIEVKVRFFKDGKLLFQGRNCPEIIGNRIALMDDSDSLTIFFYMVRPRNSFVYRCNDCNGLIVSFTKKPTDKITEFCPTCDVAKSASRMGHGNMEDVCLNQGKPLKVTVAELRAYLKQINKLPTYAKRVNKMDVDAWPK